MFCLTAIGCGGHLVTFNDNDFKLQSEKVPCLGQNMDLQHISAQLGQSANVVTATVFRNVRGVITITLLLRD